MDMEKLLKYPCEIVPLSDEDGGGYLARFPDLPDVMGDGETPEEALADGLDALKGALAALAEWGKPIPEPGSASGKMALRLPKSLHARLKLRAKADEVSENMTAVALIAEGLGRRETTTGKRVTRHEKDGRILPGKSRDAATGKQKAG
jgi:antitoxin HicB